MINASFDSLRTEFTEDLLNCNDRFPNAYREILSYWIHYIEPLSRSYDLFSFNECRFLRQLFLDLCDIHAHLLHFQSSYYCDACRYNYSGHMEGLNRGASLYQGGV